MMPELSNKTSHDESDGYSSDNSDFPMRELEHALNEPDFGILFDIDGVLARGSTPLEPAKKAMEKLKDANGHLRVPCAFVTNACNRTEDKAKQIGQWFNMEISLDQVIHAPTPAKLLRELHDKTTLVVGQEHRVDIAHDLGFETVCTIDEVKAAYPLLDMVDHDNRRMLAKGHYKDNPNFPKIEALLLIGEPTHWESNLQLLVDLLLTEGKPTEAPTDVHAVPQLPVIACNMDLVFMAEACMPRFGHGAFLVCLEALYKKITGKDLHYTSLVGKPCEITYRFAEHTISKIAKKMGFHRPIKRLYFFGDNPHVDIVGANLYDRYIKEMALNQENGNDGDNAFSDDDVTDDMASGVTLDCRRGSLVPPSSRRDSVGPSTSRRDSVGPSTSRRDSVGPSTSRRGSLVPSSRVIPETADLHDQTVEQCLSMLVGTGVYKHGTEVNKKGPDGEYVYHGHRDIAHEPELTEPHKFVHDVHQGIEYIFSKEGMSS